MDQWCTRYAANMHHTLSVSPCLARLVHSLGLCFTPICNEVTSDSFFPRTHTTATSSNNRIRLIMVGWYARCTLQERSYVFHARKRDSQVLAGYLRPTHALFCTHVMMMTMATAVHGAVVHGASTHGDLVPHSTTGDSCSPTACPPQMLNT